LSRDLARDLIKIGSTVHNMYGPTETTIWSAVAAIRDATAPIVIGRPISNTQFYVLDKTGQPSPIGVPGELYIAGDGVARGYHNRDELTTEKFVANPFSEAPASMKMFKTGDLVRWRSDGNLEFLGRLDNQIKLRGYRIELGEIESVLGEYRGIKEAAVTLSGSDDPRLVAYVVLVSGAAEPKLSDIRAFLRQRLPDYMIPSAVVTLPAMPRTPNGKLDRKSLPVSDTAKPASEYVAPSTNCERTLCEIWAHVMGKERIGVTDDIFELGGDSIRIFRIAARARQAGLQLDGMHMFKHRTISELAKMLSNPDSLAVRERLQTGPAARAARRLMSR
jgi:aryl carrier-like protein